MPTGKMDPAVLKKRRSRREQINTVDGPSMVDKFDVVTVNNISKRAWGGALGLRQAQEKITRAKWGALNHREKIKAVTSFLMGIVESQEFQFECAKWALGNPGDVMKMIVALAPKEAEVTVTHEGGVVLLPAKMASIEEWQAEVTPASV